MHIPEPSPCVMDLINAADQAVAEITSLSQLGAVIDGNEQYFSNLIVLLSIIHERAGHLDTLLSHIAHATLPRPQRVVEGQP